MFQARRGIVSVSATPVTVQGVRHWTQRHLFRNGSADQRTSICAERQSASLALCLVSSRRSSWNALPLKMAHICVPKRRYITINISCVTSHKNENLLYTATESWCHAYRVIQEESAILWGMIVCVILSKNFLMNMGQILNGYRDMVKRRYEPSCEHEQQLRNK